MHVLNLDIVYLPEERLDLKLKLRSGLLVGTLLVAPVQAQTAAAVPSAQSSGVPGRQAAAGDKMSFEVVSIRQRKPGTPGGLGVGNNRFTANFTLAGYIVYAWDLMPSREQYDSMFARLPTWVSTDRFEIQAVAEGNPTKDQMRLMVQSACRSLPAAGSHRYRRGCRDRAHSR
jgi:hypothetical protein